MVALIVGCIRVHKTMKEGCWTVAMPTEDIFSQLRALGIESSEDSFRALAAPGDSSERLFEGTWGTLWEEDTD